MVLKYSPAGALLWTRYYDAGFQDDLSAVAVDSAGSVIVTGMSYIRGIVGADFATVKWEANGAQQWVRRFDGGLGDGGVDVQVDAAGNAYVTGTSVVNKGGSTEDVLTFKYDPNGTRLWMSRFDSNAGNDQDEALRLELDGLGDVYVLGHYWVDVRPDGVLLKLRADTGASIWTRRWSRTPEDDLPLGLSVDRLGNAFVTGQTYYGAGDQNVDAYTSKFDPSGNEIWARVYNGGGGVGFDGDDRVIADGAGGVYMAGDTQDPAGYDVMAIHYLADGTQAWVQKFDGGRDDWLNDWMTMCPECNGIALDPSGDLILSGQSVRGTGWDLTTIKILTGGAGTQPPPTAQLSTLTLSPSSVTGGASAQGTVTLSAAAPAGGATLTLNSSLGAASVPATITVPAGATSGTFGVSTTAVSASTAVTITAAYGGISRSATLTVNASAPPPPPPPAATDTVSITKAEYTASQKQLRLEARSSSASATLKAYVTSTGALIGTLTNAGGGTYKAQFTWPSNPQKVTVKSSLGGSATGVVALK